MTEFKLPDVGEGMHEAEIVRWLVKPGDRVKADQVMLEIQTDKALVEIPSPVAGIVAEIRVKEGQMVPVGTVLITFDTAPATKVAEKPVPEPVLAVAATTLTKAYSNGATVTTQPSRVRAAPAVRKKAWELDVDLTVVQPSSPDGRVLLQDVLNYAEHRHTSDVGVLLVAPTNAPTNGKTEVVEAPVVETVVSTKPSVFSVAEATQDETRKPLVGLRRRIAERMELSWRTIPHVSTFEDVDAGNLSALRAQLAPTAEKRGVKLTYLPLLVKAAIYALKKTPIFNSSLDDKSREVIYKNYYHIGLATATPDGLLVPVLHHADQLTLLELAMEINRLAEGARNRSLKANELSGSTFTITNYGSYGGSVGTPIINPPEAAILGVGRIADKAVVLNGQIVVRPIMPLCLSFDHRLIDGADSGVFTNHLKEVLETPALLMLESK